ncbi:putative transcriptional regulator [Bradyrhizobium japonicum]|uniref:ASCH domain-containing protein n=1 Tax=Bradyrhizobium TaxID=374 RepID=UPI0009B8D24E|nr:MULTISPECIES: ASCH domain-containing protein [Bradyrhizobium]MCP1744338.1 putative transcriptional regulator [Bradyrhizobium japonicum]MCP1782617.1 putative transcriptional regulator [Bradyrhizobium japonicum]MCP1892810.1 putative transcriptional regulator [Bradyrhizobium japonicum]MCP1965093.1 putative transcriptional regulator [Bradyrhizobium japonicum]MCW2325935.1 putative transcriptional regulator [Bradyrhizobium japonicum]
MLALLSIKPVHTENIFSGRKTFEYRRKVFARSDVRTVLVYCTKPVGKLVGEFDIDEILQDSPSRLWKQTRTGAGISEIYFYEYFAGCEFGYALRIGNVRRFKRYIEPQKLVAEFSPPQSFMYIEESRLNSIGARTGASRCRN